MSFVSTLFNARCWLALCALLTVVLVALLALFSPQQLPVVHYKLALTLLAGLAGYWLDRVLFPFAAPSGYLNDDWRKTPNADHPDDADYPVVCGYGVIFCYAMLRQAIIIVGAMLAVSLGL